MSVKLHEMAHSPYCLPVKRILEAYAVPFEVVDVSPWDRRDLARLTGGAYYQVPVLEQGEQVIHETREDPLAVAHFLDTEFCRGELFPDHCAGLQELLIPMIENDLEGKGFKNCDPTYLDQIQDVGEKTMVLRHKERRFGAGCVEKWRENADLILGEFEESLEPFELRLQHAAYLFGDRPVYADYALFGVMGNAFYFGSPTLDRRFVSLHRWRTAMDNFSA